jgi:hypothetical protein
MPRSYMGAFPDEEPCYALALGSLHLLMQLCHVLSQSLRSGCQQQTLRNSNSAQVFGR